MSISSLTSSTPATGALSISSAPSPSNPATATLQAGAALDAGVIATLGAPATDSAGLYTNLANLATASASAASPPATTDVNTDWATAVKADPGLAPLAEQMSLNQALLNALL